jgi:hypothetical protein
MQPGLSTAKAGVGMQADRSIPDFASLNPGYLLQLDGPLGILPI